MKHFSNKSAQQGYVLFITLIFLVILTIMGLASVSLNSTQTRIATNATDTEIAFEKAEGAINQATNFLLKGTYSQSSFSQNTNGLYTLDPTATAPWSAINWTSASAVITGFQGNKGDAATYVIEQLPSVVKPGQNMNIPTYIYRITARGTGGSNNTAIMLQTTLQIQ